MSLTAETLPGALSAAQPGDTLVIAPGVHTFAAGLVVPDGVSIDGQGATLRFPATPQAADTFGLSFSGDGDSTIADLTLEGPLVATVGSKYSFAVLIGGTATAGAVTLRNVRITRPNPALTTGWYRGVTVQAGAVNDTGPFTLTLDGCDITAANGGTNVYCGADQTNKRYIAVDTEIHDCGGHAAYVHPGVEIDWTGVGVRRIRSDKFWLQHFSAGSSGAAPASFVRCAFVGSGLGVLTSDQDAATVFDGCRVNSQQASVATIQARNSVTVNRCSFVLGPNTVGVQGTDRGVLSVERCRFVGGSAHVSATGAVVEVDGCDHRLGPAEPTPGKPSPAPWGTSPRALRAIAPAGRSVTVSFHDCRVVGAVTEAIHVQVLRNATVTIEDCEFSGQVSPTGAAIVVDHATGSVTATRCLFDLLPGSEALRVFAGVGALVPPNTQMRFPPV